MNRKFCKTCAAVMACLSILCTGFQAFAATSDSYTGYSSNGTYSAKVICKINGTDGLLKDSCKSSTSTPSGAKVIASVEIYNKYEDAIAGTSSDYTPGTATAYVQAYDNNSAAYAVSGHGLSDDVYGTFLYFLGCTFNGYNPG